MNFCSQNTTSTEELFKSLFTTNISLAFQNNPEAVRSNKPTSIQHVTVYEALSSLFNSHNYHARLNRTWAVMTFYYSWSTGSERLIDSPKLHRKYVMRVKSDFWLQTPCLFLYTSTETFLPLFQMKKLRHREVKTLPKVTQQDWLPTFALGTQVWDEQETSVAQRIIPDHKGGQRGQQ